MAIEHKLELRLSQKLILTPQLQQSIKLLQLPLLELSTTLNQELMENPFLEEAVERETEGKSETDTPKSEETEAEGIPGLENMEASLEKMFGFTTDEYFEERGSDGRDLGYFTTDIESTVPIERNIKRMNLYEYLLWQLRFLRVSERLKRTAEVIIGNLDEDGYLQPSATQRANMAQVN